MGERACADASFEVSLVILRTSNDTECTARHVIGVVGATIGVTVGVTVNATHDCKREEKNKLHLTFC